MEDVFFENLPPGNDMKKECFNCKKNHGYLLCFTKYDFIVRSWNENIHQIFGIDYHLKPDSYVCSEEFGYKQTLLHVYKKGEKDPTQQPSKLQLIQIDWPSNFKRGAVQKPPTNDLEAVEKASKDCAEPAGVIPLVQIGNEDDINPPLGLETIGKASEDCAEPAGVIPLVQIENEDDINFFLGNQAELITSQEELLRFLCEGYEY